jgi:hypothetical protein
MSRLHTNTVSFYGRDLSICVFWYLWVSYSQLPTDAEGRLRVCVMLGVIYLLFLWRTPTDKAVLLIDKCFHLLSIFKSFFTSHGTEHL